LGTLGSVRGALSNERPYRDLRYVVTKYPFTRRISADPADFWPQRPFAFELRCLGHAARPASAGIKDDPLKPGEAMSEKR
jgi:hypothetical protein